MKKKVVVVIGIGGMGLAIARRIGTGNKLILADFSKDRITAAANDLQDSGYDVYTKEIDVVNADSVQNLAKTASELGEIYAVVHTVGVSSTMADPVKILKVNLVGTGNMLNAFEKFLLPGAVGIVISSMAGHHISDSSSELLQQIQHATIVELNTLIENEGLESTITAYLMSKRGNQLQVQAAALPWGERGARILSISPGIIGTAQAKQEMVKYDSMRNMIENGPVKRIGTPQDIAALVEFLCSSAASFMTGTDILIDGGAVAFTKLKNK